MNEEVVGQCAHALREHAVFGLARIRAEHAQAAQQHRHFGRAQAQQLRLVHQQFGRVVRELGPDVIAEGIGLGFEHRERCGIGLLGRGVGAAGRERHRHGPARRLGRRFHRGAARKHDEVGQRDLLAVLLRGIEFALHRFERCQHLGQFGRLIDGPIFLRREPDARAVGAAAFVAAAEGRGRGPGGAHQLRHAQARGEHTRLECGHVPRIDERMIDRGQRVLPDQGLGGHLLAEVTRTRPHVAMGQLEPGAGEGIGESVGVGQKAARDLFVGRVVAQRQIGGEHHRRMALLGVVRIGHRPRARIAFGLPLVRAGRAFGQFPFIAEQGFEIAHVPARGRGLPGAFEATRDRMHADAGAVLAAPTQALRFDVRGLGFGAHIARRPSAVRLAEGMAARDQGDGFFIVHRHAGKSLADVARRGDRIGIAVRPFGVHIDEAHLHGGQRVVEFTLALVTAVGFLARREPFGFRAPVGVFAGLPDVGPAAREAEGLEAHGFERDIARENHQIGP